METTWEASEGAGERCYESSIRAGARLVAAGLALVLFGRVVASAQTDEECLACHADKEIVKEVPSGELVSVYVDEEPLRRSVHGFIECVACHQDLADTELPHKSETEAVDCTGCHGAVAEAYEQSVHWQGIRQGESAAPRCRDCHGTHYVLAKDNPESSVYRLNLPKTCGACHDNPDIISRHRMRGSFSSYASSIHGKAVLQWGLTVAADCADCHEAHDVKRGDDPGSPVARANVAATCGRCHPGSLNTWRRGVHGVIASEGKSEAAVCTDCHGEHTIRAPVDRGSSVYVTRIVDTCARCHANKEIVGRFGLPLDRVSTYRESFHGIGTKFGSTVVANCVSCHGHHEIKPQSDPSSSINPANLKQTCGQPRCHPGATELFAKGRVHVSFTGTDDQILMAIRAIYVFLVGATIGGMIVHNTVDYMGKRRLRRAAKVHQWPKR